MRRLLLDTSVLVGYFNGRERVVSLIDPWLDRQEVATSVLVYAETIEFLMGQPDYERRSSSLRQLLHRIYPYDLTYAVLETYAEIRRSLRPPFGPGLIGDVDSLIAATARERHLTLVSTDGDFKAVPGLSLLLLERREWTVLEER